MNSKPVPQITVGVISGKETQLQSPAWTDAEVDSLSVTWRMVFEHKRMWAEEGIRVGEDDHRIYNYMQQKCAKEPRRVIEINLNSGSVPHVALKDKVASADI